MEDPHWSFAISPSSNLTLRVANQVAVPYGVISGSITHTGTASLTDRATGRVQNLGALELAYLPVTVDGPAGPHPSDQLVMRDPQTGEPVFDIVGCMYDFHYDQQVLWIRYANLRFADDWARRQGRPELSGWTVGLVEVEAQVQLTGGDHDPGNRPVPNLAGYIDVSLGGLSSISQVGHDGTYPSGTVALSMNTTSCNVGTADVPWLAPMQENHPLIAMALYRLREGRFEQLGISWDKHGFYALSNSDCSQCQHPSDGTFLGVGCSDTYAVGNNGDRNYLGPRKEVNAVTSVWTCRGSYFAGYQDDCIRRQGGGGLGPLDHRLNALDADLNLPGATYFYEADYMVRQDVDRTNNIGSRICTMSWNGQAWVFQTPTSNNPLVSGPAINRWGDLRTQAAVDTSDGFDILGVAVTSLGNGQYHYEYALFNRSSDLGVHSFSLPVGTSNVTNIGFHDSDYDPTDDWQVTLQDGTITWQTDTQETNPAANQLGYGQLFNFRFDSDTGPDNISATLETFKPHTPRQFTMATRGPSPTAGVRPASVAGSLRLEPCRPNPLSPNTTIRFALASDREARLQVFDSQGRRLRTLASGALGAGSHESTWNGSDDSGRRLPCGVYYVSLRSGSDAAVRSVTLLK